MTPPDRRADDSAHHVDATRPAVGDTIPPLVRSTGLLEWNRYAAVNDEFVTIHMDDAAARRAGLPGAIGMGNLQVAYLHVLLRNWIQPAGRILRLACQHRGYNLAGDTLTCHGCVTAIRGLEIDLDVWVENQDGVILSPGSATVLWSDDGER